mgnify:CR=1 FL=1
MPSGHRFPSATTMDIGRGVQIDSAIAALKVPRWLIAWIAICVVAISLANGFVCQAEAASIAPAFVSSTPLAAAASESVAATYDLSGRQETSQSGSTCPNGHSHCVSLGEAPSAADDLALQPNSSLDRRLLAFLATDSTVHQVHTPPPRR